MNLDEDVILVDSETLPGVHSSMSWRGDDIVLPIKLEDNSIILKKLSDTTDQEFRSWTKSVMPFTDEILNLFQKTKLSSKEKKATFETIVTIHWNRFLLGAGRQIIPAEFRWN